MEGAAVPERQAQALEQDDAAGGRTRRIMPEGGALGRIVLRCQHNRIYAELRWQFNKKLYAEYLGGFSAATRAANLAAAWQYAHDNGLTASDNVDAIAQRPD